MNISEYEDYTCTGCGKEFAIANSLVAAVEKLQCQKCGEGLRKSED